MRSLAARIEEGQYHRISGYPLYEIDQFANVRRIFKTKRVLLIPTFKNGVFVVRLMSPCGIRKEERIHKLMQKTFMDPPKPGQVLYHRNQNRRDNCLANLAYIDKRILGRMTGAKSRRRPVAKIDKNDEIVEIYTSAREAARRNFMSYQTVMDRCNHRTKNLYAPDGYRYQWDDDDSDFSDRVETCESNKRGRTVVRALTLTGESMQFLVQNEKD